VAPERLNCVAVPGKDFQSCQVLVKFKIAEEERGLGWQAQRPVPELGLRQLVRDSSFHLRSVVPSRRERADGRHHVLVASPAGWWVSRRRVNLPEPAEARKSLSAMHWAKPAAAHVQRYAEHCRAADMR